MPQADGLPPIITIREVAEHAGVSAATASRALRHDRRISPATTARVEDAALALGYQPGVRERRIALVDSKLIGMVGYPGQDHHQALVDATESVALERGYNLLPLRVSAAYPEQDCWDLLAAKRVRGLMLVDSKASNSRLLEISAAVPTVLVGSAHLDLKDVDQVYSSNLEGLRQACSTLAADGHRKLLALAGPNGASASRRISEVKIAAEEAGLALRIVDAGNTEGAGADAVVSAYRAGLLGAPDGATCVVGYNDQCAIGALIALLRLGLRVPEDISVLGVDGSERAAAHGIELTTVTKPIKAMAEAALTLLEGRMASERKGRRSGSQVGVESSLSVRSSLGRFTLGEG
ncbi:MAG: LacI family transcriptional regulator [Propionibacteriaceae bacterium]|jgi:DNA-binding LacI/PurR family transcriptional regulator|nr:LacI family transcriptional regulator [Propionibacteriaceae bacterium]